MANVQCFFVAVLGRCRREVRDTVEIARLKAAATTATAESWRHKTI